MKNTDRSEMVKGKDNFIDFLMIIAVLMVVFVSGLFFLKFHGQLSDEKEDWGVFGDYFGGILNPVVASFALYLIVKTYNLQKKELEDARTLQNEQLRLAALTPLYNVNLMMISQLELEKERIIEVDAAHEYPFITDRDEAVKKYKIDASLSVKSYPERVSKIDGDIEHIKMKNMQIVSKLETYVK